MKFRFARLLLTGMLVLTISGIVSASEPIQLALFNPIQLRPESASIEGLRISLLYGKNAGMTGLDWGLVNHVTGKTFAWQIGGVGICEQGFTGLQDNFINITKGECLGVQYGAFNYLKSGTALQWGILDCAGNVTGVQLGFINYADKVTGVQWGFVNYAKSLKGLQVGLGNFIVQGGFMPFFPIINFSF